MTNRFIAKSVFMSKAKGKVARLQLASDNNAAQLAS
jgi:hypothetical protein